MSEEIDYRIQKLLETLDERFKDAERRLASGNLEFEDEVLEAISKLSKRLDVYEKRLLKLEDNSSWNLLIEEAQKLKMTPEQFLKRMITDYLKRKDK